MSQLAVEVIQPRREPSPSYRDELNFAEFPLAALTDQIPKGQKTLEFTDNIFDSGRRQVVTRKLTISASDKHGLPTALDDEVILGLIQLSHRNGFADPRVHFSRYELIKLLGWRDESKSYVRIAESLNRWVGVTLYYEKAWWSKEEQCWVDESFHILEQVTLFDRERRERHRSTRQDDPNAGLSSVVWNSVVFNSFKSGYLKQLDLELYKRLESRIAKRIYRFLDKRFYHKARHEFDLREFACEHVGLSKGYHNGEIKRRLRPAIGELEKMRFLEPLSEGERFHSAQRGDWQVVFVKCGGAKRTELEAVPTADETVQALLDLGVTQASARELVERFESTRIKEKIALTKWLLAKKDRRVSQNPGGFLYAAIVKDYELPADYVQDRKRKGSVKPAAVQAQLPLTEPVDVTNDRAELDAYWTSLSENERDRFEEEAVRRAEKFLADQYRSGKEGGGSLFRAVRQAILDQHIRRNLLKPRARALPTPSSEAYNQRATQRRGSIAARPGPPSRERIGS